MTLNNVPSGQQCWSIKRYSKHVFSVCWISGSMLLAGCSNVLNSHIEYETVQPDSYPVLYATGYAPIEQQAGEDIEAKIINAMTASKAQAYKELAAQLHGLGIQGSQQIGAMVVQDTALQTQILGLVRGAKIQKSYQQGNNTYVTE